MKCTPEVDLRYEDMYLDIFVETLKRQELLDVQILL